MGILELQRSGVGEGELLEAFRACLAEAPERVTFFPRDFLKWRKRSRHWLAEARSREQEERHNEEEKREREAERQRVLAEREDPGVAAVIKAAIASLPWNRGRSHEERTAVSV